MKIQEYKQHVNTAGEGFMKLVTGENKVRLVSEFEQFQDSYKGVPNQRFMCYVIDRKDSKIKPMTVGAMVFGQVGALSISSEFGFTSDVPPYDIIIGKSGEDKETKYVVQGARNNSDLTEDEKAEVAKLKPITEVIEKTLAKKSPQVPVEDDDGIPIINSDQDNQEDVGPLPF